MTMKRMKIYKRLANAPHNCSFNFLDFCSGQIVVNCVKLWQKMSNNEIQNSAAMAGGTRGSVGLLVGRFPRSLDPKRRLTIPGEWRTVLGLNAKGAYVYVMLDPRKDCLDMVPHQVMEERLAQRSDNSLFGDLDDEDYEDDDESIGENMQICEVDSQGRIRISERLLALADIKLEGDVLMRGKFGMAQIWSADKLPADAKFDKAKYRAAMARKKL